LREIEAAVQPHNTLLVVDAMTGQEAVNVAETFHESIGLDGVVLTKIDGDARGGAALSVKEVVGKPILFAGTGEKLEDFEPFHPDRMASRILGMGDVLTLIEKAEEAFDDEQKAKAERIVLEGQFTLEDFLEQMQQVKKMGPISNLIGMMPGLPKEVKKAQIDDSELVKIEAIIHSMTTEERRNPTVVNGSRRTRIAKGSGTTTSDVNQLLKQFKQVQQMMRSFGGGAGGAGGKKGKKGKRPRLSDLRALQQMEGLPELPGAGKLP
jgi:signal recognition particle subunit SRP54